jgi:hypothetical protein
LGVICQASFSPPAYDLYQDGGGDSDPEGEQLEWLTRFCDEGPYNFGVDSNDEMDNEVLLFLPSSPS